MSKVIGTHSGRFHADEALACFMLHQLPAYKDAKIVRTRDEAQLAKCDIVVDVGAVFDPATHRYDHHQRTFAHTMKSLGKLPYETKLSSAGLVYAHFGLDVIRALAHTDLDDASVQLVFDKLYESLIEEIDGIDNGIEPFTGEPRYKTTTGLSSRVGRIWPAWNEKQPASDAEADQLFIGRAMPLVGAEFTDRLRYIVGAWLPARDIVAKAYNERKNVHNSGHIMVLPDGGVPWKEHLFQLEREGEPKVVYTIFTDTNGTWRVQAVPVQPSSFQNRHSLLEAWRGIRNEELRQKSGIDGAIFVHASGFIGGAETRDQAMQMAVRSLEGYKE